MNGQFPLEDSSWISPLLPSRLKNHIPSSSAGCIFCHCCTSTSGNCSRTALIIKSISRLITPSIYEEKFIGFHQHLNVLFPGRQRLGAHFAAELRRRAPLLRRIVPGSG